MFAAFIGYLIAHTIIGRVNMIDKIEFEQKQRQCEQKNMCIEEVDGKYECVECKSLGIE